MINNEFIDLILYGSFIDHNSIDDDDRYMSEKEIIAAYPNLFDYDVDYVTSIDIFEDGEDSDLLCF